jgi:hypothetical protein
MPSDPIPGYHWEGEYTEIEETLWWCPSDEEWCWCPGPCPDGREHFPSMTKTVQTKKLVSDAQ